MSPTPRNRRINLGLCVAAGVAVLAIPVAAAYGEATADPPPPPPPSARAAETSIDQFLADHPVPPADQRGGSGLSARLELSMGCQRAAGAEILVPPEAPDDYSTSYSVDDPAEGEAVSDQLQRCRAAYEDASPAADDAAFLALVQACADDADIAIAPLEDRSDVVSIAAADWAAIEPCVAEGGDG